MNIGNMPFAFATVDEASAAVGVGAVEGTFCRGNAKYFATPEGVGHSRYWVMSRFEGEAVVDGTCAGGPLFREGWGRGRRRRRGSQRVVVIVVVVMVACY